MAARRDVPAPALPGKTGEAAVAEQLLKSSSASRNQARATVSRFQTWQSLILPTCIVVIGSCVLAGVYGFLAFLWFAGPDQRVWHRIVLAGWVARSVALSSLCIRWVVSIQAVLCTSVLASCFLAGGAPLSAVPKLSTMRYMNSGPWVIGSHMIMTWRHSEIHSGLVAIACLLACTTLLSQFSSTLLLSDLAAVSVPSAINETAASLGFVNDTYGLTYLYKIPRYNDAFLSGQPSYPVFAEYSQPEEAVKLPGIDDTGPVIRSLLPLTVDGGRVDILDFRGNATVFDARVVCIQPEFQDLSLLGNSRAGNLSLVGRVKPSKSMEPTLILPPDGNLTAFNCTVPWVSTLGPGLESEQWPITVCQLEERAGGLLSAVDPAYNTSLEYYVIRDEGTFNGRWWTREFERTMTFVTWIPLGHPYLVLNFTNTSYFSDESGSIPDVYWNATQGWQFDPREQWVRMISSQPDAAMYYADGYNLAPLSASDLGWSIDATICYDGFYDTKNILIEANRTRAVPEPASMSGGLQQIGASLPIGSFEDRGILRLSESELKHQFDINRDALLRDPSYYNESSLATSNPFSLTLNFYRAWRSTYNGLVTNPNTSRVLFYQDPLLQDDLRSVSEERVSLFQHILQSTESPALALQALLHTLTTDGFYRLMPYWDIPSNYTTSFSVLALQPVQTLGFFIVLACLVVHAVLVGIITIFLSGVTKSHGQSFYNSIDNAWQAHAQILSPEVEEILRDPATTKASDNDLTRSLNKQGKRGKMMILSLNEEDEHGAVRLRRRYP